MENQKKNLRRLNVVSKLFDLNSFYSVSFTDTGIILQGRFSSDITKKAVSLRFKSEVSINGYLEFNRSIYTITLT
jgi:hypothetical protein